MKTKLFNTKESKYFRRELRQQDVACEKHMWAKLRNRGLMDLKFRRQYSIGQYTVDFYCPEIKLVIEIDGATHGTAREIAHDTKRQEYLEGLGLIVKRYTNTDVKHNLSDLMYDLAEFCEELRESQTLP